MTLHVTKKDIQSGKREDVSGCPIALTIKRAMTKMGFRLGQFVVDVTQSSITIAKKSRSGGYIPVFSMNCDSKASKFVDRFDAYGTTAVAPMDIKLPNLRASLRQTRILA